MKALRSQTISKYDDLTDNSVYIAHAHFLTRCANELLLPQKRHFVIDEHNQDVLRFLTYYFNQCPLANDPSQYRSPNYAALFQRSDLAKNIMIVGGVGTGKTLMMQAFGLYLERTQNPLAFKCSSVTEMLHYYKVNEHLDYYTYNTGKGSAEASPLAFCMNDVGLETMKHYGNDLQQVIDEYFHARNEIFTQWYKRSHITSNLDKAHILELFNDPYKRLEDRFKTYNIIPLVGESRR